MRGWFFVVPAVLILNTILLAAPAEHPATADLIADVSTVQPGQPFHVAVWVTMKPGYHIYWIDPGDSGQATEIKWHAPDGWKIEPLPFPTPHKFTMPGDIVNNGYSDTVLFLATVTPPAEAKGSVELSADAEWLVCDVNRCLPGKASPKLTVAVGEKATPANQELFKSWRDQLPVPAFEKAEHIDFADDGIGHLLRIAWNDTVKNVQVFTAPGNGWLLGDQKTTGEAKKTEFSFTAKPIGKETKPSDMVVLIAYDDAGGVRRSVQLTIPLKP